VKLDEANKGPPVSESALKAWAEAFKIAYGDTPQDKLETAYKSAEGMFPGKFAARDRIRELLKGRKRGPKPRA